MTLEDIIEREMIDLQLPEKPVKKQKIGNQLIVAGLPVVSLSKVDQLKKFIKGKMKYDDINIPMDENNQSIGVIFVRFSNEEIVTMVHKQFNGTSLDKSHTYKTSPLIEFHQLLKENEEWKEPEPQTFKLKSDMHSWLQQRQCRDQLLVHSRSDINIFEHSQKNLEQKWSKSEFTDSIVLWSPLGYYMATIHDKGIALWGGEKFGQINRFLHMKVRQISFSPNEKYVMTYSLNNLNYIVKVWDVLIGSLIREFIIPKSDEDESQFWPEFRWSFDTYFARKQKDKISVYHSDNCVMVDKKSIDIIGVKDFTWSTKGHLLSYWVGEQESTPARVVLISLPTKKEIFAKTLFNVVDISLKWSAQDDYLAVISERYTKKKIVDNQLKSIGLSASLEIYRVKEKEIPVEKIPIGEKTQIVAHDWESNGSKLAVLTFNQKTTNILIFDLRIIGQPQKLMDYTFATRMTLMKWSPQGQFIACSTANSSSIEFIDGHDGCLLRRVETHNLNDLVWDPTGRYLLSYRLSLLNDVSECSVSFHSITGRLLMEKSFPGLKQIMWRPRPPCSLSEQEIKNIKKNMGKYNHQFAHQDEMMSNDAKRKLMEDRQRMMQDWLATKARITVNYGNEKSIRVAMRNNIDTDNLEHGKFKEQTYVLVSSRIELLSH